MVASLVGCSSDQPQGLSDLSNVNPEGSGINSIRIKALIDTATGIGAQGGLSWRSTQINHVLEDETQYLNKIYNFNLLLLKYSVLPPVLDTADNVINMDGGQAVRIASQTYQIISPPRFVSTAPTWREYLAMNYPKPTLPDSTLLPKTDEEEQIWNKYVILGWHQGVDQANQIFSANLARLGRDFIGMVRYKELLAKNMVSAPYVATTDLGITGGGAKIRIGDKVLRITALSSLNADSQTWKPAISHKK